MNLFTSSFLIVSGILLPFVLIIILMWLLRVIFYYVESRKLLNEKKLCLAKKAAPYDDVKLSQPPNHKMFGVRLIKNGEIVYEGFSNKENYKLW